MPIPVSLTTANTLFPFLWPQRSDCPVRHGIVRIAVKIHEDLAQQRSIALHNEVLVQVEHDLDVPVQNLGDDFVGLLDHIREVKGNLLITSASSRKMQQVVDEVHAFFHRVVDVGREIRNIRLVSANQFRYSVLPEIAAGYS